MAETTVIRMKALIPQMELRGYFPRESIPVDSRRLKVEVVSDLENMTKELPTIEVEVVEVDGVTVAPRSEAPQEQASPWARAEWRQWQGRVAKLDGRWWPLWFFFGIVALALMLTVGVVLGVIFVIFQIIRGFLRALFG